MRRVWIRAREVIPRLGDLFADIDQLFPIHLTTSSNTTYTSSASRMLLLLLCKVFPRLMIRGQPRRADGLAGVVVASAGLWFAGVSGVEACLLVEALLFGLVGELVVLLLLCAVFVLLGGDGVGGVVCVVDGGVLVEDLFEGIHVDLAWFGNCLFGLFEDW